MEPINHNAIIIGAGGLGRELASVIQNYFSDKYSLLGFVDDGIEKNTFVDDVEVLGGVNLLIEYRQQVCVFMGLGNPSVRIDVLKKLKGNQQLEFPNLFHPFARIHNNETVSFGKGNIISDSVIFTTGISIGNFNLINLSATVGHDVAIGNFCSIMPSVNISGGTQIKDSVYIGTGAKLINATTLGSHSIIGAGAVVNTDIPSGETWGGVPAKKLSVEK